MVDSFAPNTTPMRSHSRPVNPLKPRKHGIDFPWLLGVPRNVAFVLGGAPGCAKNNPHRQRETHCNTPQPLTRIHGDYPMTHIHAHSRLMAHTASSSTRAPSHQLFGSVPCTHPGSSQTRNPAKMSPSKRTTVRGWRIGSDALFGGHSSPSCSFVHGSMSMGTDFRTTRLNFA